MKCEKCGNDMAIVGKHEWVNCNICDIHTDMLDSGEIECDCGDNGDYELRVDIEYKCNNCGNADYERELYDCDYNTYKRIAISNCDIVK